MGFLQKLFGGGGQKTTEAMVGEVENEKRATSRASVAGASFQMTVQDVFSIGDNSVVVGRVEGGAIKVGEEIAVNGLTATVKSIEMNKQQVATAYPNDTVGLVLVGITKADARSGNVVTKNTAR